jgi:isoquinoline 1-oxidoreductase beta subunit
MGQGVSTALAIVLAEEPDLDWKKVNTVFVPAGPQYFTRGSCSVPGSWQPLAKAGAATREMLVGDRGEALERGAFCVSHGK